MNPIEIEYQEFEFSEVIKYFQDGIKLNRPGFRIAKWEAYCDPQKGKVIFKLFIEGEANIKTLVLKL